MKSTKLLVLLAALALAACEHGTSSNNQSVEGDSRNAQESSEVAAVSSEEQVSSSENVDAVSSSSETKSSSEVKSSSEKVSSSTTVSSSKEEKSSSAASSSQVKTSVAASSSQKQSSSAAVSSSIAASSSAQASSSEATENSYTINFVNPTCGTASTEVINDRLVSYINGEVGFNLISSVTNTSCQLNTGFPTAGNTILIIGASKTAGSLKFNFTTNVQAITIKAQTYHKPYTDGTGYHSNVDTNSVLVITSGSSNELDLKPVDGEPVEKEFTKAIQSRSLTLASKNDSKGRVFIKEITFTL